VPLLSERIQCEQIDEQADGNECGAKNDAHSGDLHEWMLKKRKKKNYFNLIICNVFLLVLKPLRLVPN
jgi:hypothetical protein